MNFLDSEELSGRETYRLLTNLIVPRPIALVTTKSRDGVLNCAPFSFYQGVCGSPPILSLSIARNRSGLKDTFRNILLNNEFVVHVPQSEHVEDVELAGQTFDPDVSEVEKIGFTPVESSKVSVDGLEELPVRMECQLHDQMPVAGGKVTVVFGEVVCWHLSDDVYGDGEVDFDSLDPLARVGPDSYTSLSDIVTPDSSESSGNAKTNPDNTSVN